MDVTPYVGLVEDVINDYMKSRNLKWRMDLKDDLIGEGFIALMKSATDFDPERGVQFHTYASNRIRAAAWNFVAADFKRNTPLLYIEDIGDHRLVMDDARYAMSYKAVGDYDRGSFDLIDKFEPACPINKAIYHEIIMGTATYREVAEEFGIKVQAIKKRKQRLLKRLKKEMEDGKS